MKNRFIRKFLVICAAMLFVCAVSVWAAAEETTPATPTDLTPVETADSVPGATEPETTEPDTTVPDTTEPQDPVNETIEPEEPAEGEDAADAVELVITKAVRVGDSWSGVMKKTKPAILKLDVAQAQQVNLLVQGRHVWIAVEKADRLTENPARTLTENSKAIISWHAEAGSYLITLGPVEPNLMAKANVSILDDAAYGEWLAQQQAEEVTEEEPTEVTEETEEQAEESAEEPEETEESEEPAEETVEEIPEEETEEAEEATDEPDEITEEEEETEELSESGADTDNPEETSEVSDVPETEEKESLEEKQEESITDKENEIKEKEDEAEKKAESEEDLILAGYYKVQVARTEGTDIYSQMDTESEVVSHLEAGAEMWVKSTDDALWAECYQNDEQDAGYLLWDDLIIILKEGQTETQEQEEETEELPARSVMLSSTLTNMTFISFGTEIHMQAELMNFQEDDVYTCQWQYSADGENYIDIENADELSYSYKLDTTNYSYSWRINIILDNEEE